MYKTKFHWLGQTNRHSQKYITRNGFFGADSSKDWVDSCLADVALAFKYNKPAVISSHRVNFTGSLDNRNRDYGNKQLTNLLKKITSNWPQVEFLTSSELGKELSKMLSTLKKTLSIFLLENQS